MRLRVLEAHKSLDSYEKKSAVCANRKPGRGADVAKKKG
jgi:hypothetical protein